MKAYFTSNKRMLRKFSQCTCFFTYGQCLGRKFGQSILTSNIKNKNHPVYAANQSTPILFHFFHNTLHLSYTSVEKLYDIYQLIDSDNSGEIEIDEYLLYFELHKSRFAKRAFEVLDSDGSGAIDFNEFVVGLYNFLTFDSTSLCNFAFTIYDEDNSGYLDEKEIEKIVKDLYGKRNYKKNISAQKCIEQLKSLEWIKNVEDHTITKGSNDSYGSGRSNGFQQKEIDFDQFQKFCGHHSIMLLPAFIMQFELQKKILGSGFWDALAVQRKKLEAECNKNVGGRGGRGDDLLNELKGMVSALNEEIREDEGGKGVIFNFDDDDCTYNYRSPTPPGSLSNATATTTKTFKSPPVSPSNLCRVPDGSLQHKQYRKSPPQSPSNRLKNKYLVLSHSMSKRMKNGSIGSSNNLSKTAAELKAIKKQKLKAKYKKEMREARQVKSS